MIKNISKFNKKTFFLNPQTFPLKQKKIILTIFSLFLLGLVVWDMDSEIFSSKLITFLHIDVLPA